LAAATVVAEVLGAAAGGQRSALALRVLFGEAAMKEGALEYNSEARGGQGLESVLAAAD
jgi:hypothetical protein